MIVELARFTGRSGVEETHLMAWPTRWASIDRQLDWLRRGCDEVLALTGVPGDVVARRFFCSDLANQARALGSCPFSRPVDRDGACAVSWVGQAPPAPAKVGVWAYHIADPRGALDKSYDGRSLTVRRGALAHHWTFGLENPGSTDARRETQEVLTTYEAILHAAGMCIAENLVRTWLFLRDIASDYPAFATARREHFALRGLTPHTHYVASTGIGGTCGAPGTPDMGRDHPPPAIARLGLDAYAISGLRAEQVNYLRAPAHLCPTSDYGVTFERGASVSYADRTHVFISGTASIDAAGRLLHEGDVERQLDRTLANIDALLAEGGAGGDDLCMLIAYVRDPADEFVVRRGVRAHFAGVPLMIVTASVCRPGWLVEIEGLAIVPATRGPECFPPF